MNDEEQLQEQLQLYGYVEAKIPKTTTLRERYTNFMGDENNYHPCYNRECEGCLGPLDDDKMLAFLENEVQEAERKAKIAEAILSSDMYSDGKKAGRQEAVEQCVLPEANKTKITWETGRLTTEAFMDGYNYYRFKILEIKKELLGKEKDGQKKILPLWFPPI